LRKWHINEGVIGISLLFFVSGYLFALAVQTKQKRYLLRRFVRLYPSYILSVIILILVRNIWGNGVPNSPINLLFHICMIPDIMKANPLDPVLWTLWVQIHFYISYFLVFRKKPITFQNLVLLSLIVCGITIVAQQTRLEKLPGFIGGLSQVLSSNGIYFLFTSLGIVAYMHNARKWTNKQALLILSVIYGLFLIAAMTGETYGLRDEVLVSFSLGALVVVIIYVIRNAIKENKILIILSAATFPLYLLHRGLGIALYPTLITKGLSYWEALFTICVVLVGLALSINYIEDRIKHKLHKLLMTEEPLL
ncbi:MAG: acyltransferase family protein, partial [bacterium]